MEFSEVWAMGLFGIMGSKNIVLFILGWVICIVLSYLLGSLNFGIIISRYKYKDDVRKHGSGNAGTTNILRTYGKKAALFTYLGDVLKGVAAVLIVGRMTMGYMGAYVAGLFCVIGHMYPCFFGFKGGKGVATTSAVVLCLNPLLFVILLAIFIFTVLFTKYVSFGSVLSVALYPLLLNKLGGQGIGVLVAFIIAVLVVFKHWENIKRIRKGTENKLELFKKKEKKQ